MNERLLAYLRSLGLDQGADETAADSFFRSLSGSQATVANLLNYAENDEAARTSCDLAIRSLGFDPAAPSVTLELEPAGGDAGLATRSQPGPTGPQPSVAQLPASQSPFAPLIEVQQAATPTVDSDPLEQGRSLERARVMAIRDTGEMADIPATMVDEAINGGWTLERSRERFLDYRRNRQPVLAPDLGDSPGLDNAAGRVAIHTRNSQTGYTRAALTAAMMIREGVDDPTTCFPVGVRGDGQVMTRNVSGTVAQNDEFQRAIEQGHELAPLTQVDLLARALRLDGHNDVLPTPDGIVSAVQNRAALGLANFSGVFTDSYTAQMMAAYEALPDLTTSFTRTEPVRNYNTNERVRMGKAPRLSKRLPGQEAVMGSLSDQVETYKVAEFAKQFVYDIQHLINDTFQSLGEYTPQAMAEASRELRPDLVYALVLSNPTMKDGNRYFSAAHGNDTTGANPLNIDNLSAARTKMALQQEGSRPLNLRANTLLHPEVLTDTADNLMTAAAIAYGGTTVIPNANANARRPLTTVGDARLDLGVIDPSDEVTAYAGSATDYYLFAGGQADIVVGYVASRGQNPQVRSTPLSQGSWGQHFDITHSLGAGVTGFRRSLRVSGSD